MILQTFLIYFFWISRGRLLLQFGENRSWAACLPTSHHFFLNGRRDCWKRGGGAKKWWSRVCARIVPDFFFLPDDLSEITATGYLQITATGYLTIAGFRIQSSHFTFHSRISFCLFLSQCFFGFCLIWIVRNF